MATDASRYRILDRIAAGGMGEVYRATMEVAGAEKVVALKVVRAELSHDPRFAELFAQEAKIAMTLSHANVVQSFDFGRLDDRFFLAMEHVDGVNLSTLLELSRETTRGRLTIAQALFVATEALKGLDYAHRRKRSDGVALGLVHRDVSPSNLLVSFEGEVKVADFGIALSTVTQDVDGQVKGKVPYMAPEQLRGGAVDRRADLFAVGCVLYEMLTGQRRVGTGLAAVTAVLTGDFLAPSVIVPDLPEALERIVMRSLSLDPAQRHPSAAAMREELESFAHDRGLRLSSSELADLVHERAATPRVEEPRVPSIPTTPNSPRAADPFDAILGRELLKVRSDEPFSVLVTDVGRTTPLKRGPPKEGPKENAEPKPIARPVEPPSRSPLWLGTIALLVTAAASVYAFTLSSQDSEVQVAPLDASVVDAARVEIGPPPPDVVIAHEVRPPEGNDDPPPAIDAAVPAEDTRPARVRPPITRVTRDAAVATPAPSRPTLLSVNSVPWSYVEIDGARIRATPLMGHPVAPGRHTITLRNPAEGLVRTVNVDVAEGEHDRVTLDLHSP